MTAAIALRELRKAMEEMDSGELLNTWKVLTALRGPDSGDEGLKDDTTAVVRGAVFGTNLMHDIGATALSWNGAYEVREAVDRRGLKYNHFGWHVVTAAEVVENVYSELWA